MLYLINEVISNNGLQIRHQYQITDNNFQIIYAPEKLVMHVMC